MPRKVKFTGQREIAPGQVMLEFEDDAGNRFNVPESVVLDKRGGEIAAKVMAGYDRTPDEQIYYNSMPYGTAQYTGPATGPDGPVQTYRTGGVSMTVPGSGSDARKHMQGNRYAVLPGPSLEEMQGTSLNDRQLNETAENMRRAYDEVDIARMMYQQRMRDKNAAPPAQYDVEIGQPVVTRQPQYAVDIGDSEPTHLSALKRLRRQLGLED